MTNQNAARIMQTNNMVTQLAAMSTAAPEIVSDPDAQPIIARNIAAIQTALANLLTAVNTPAQPPTQPAS